MRRLRLKERQSYLPNATQPARGRLEFEPRTLQIFIFCTNHYAVFRSYYRQWTEPVSCPFHPKPLPSRFPLSSSVLSSSPSSPTLPSHLLSVHTHREPGTPSLPAFPLLPITCGWPAPSQRLPLTLYCPISAPSYTSCSHSTQTYSRAFSPMS